jgi:protein TonB
MPVSLICLLLVVVVHAGALGVMFYGPNAKHVAIQLPTVQGILIPAPPAETVQLPSAQETPPPVEPPPEPEKPKPKPEPKKPEPTPKPKPIVKAPPSEKAITQEEQVEESAPPPQAVQQQIATPKAEENNTLGAPVTPPQEDASHLNNPRPAYPSLSRRLREQGTVVLELLIKTDGSVGEVRVKESSGFKRLDNTAMKAVRQWRYTPARRGTEAIEYWYLQPVEFALN